MVWDQGEESRGKAVVALAREGVGDAKGPLLDLTSYDTGSHCRT